MARLSRSYYTLYLFDVLVLIYPVHTEPFRFIYVYSLQDVPRTSPAAQAGGPGRSMPGAPGSEEEHADLVEPSHGRRLILTENDSGDSKTTVQILEKMTANDSVE